MAPIKYTIRSNQAFIHIPTWRQIQYQDFYSEGSKDFLFAEIFRYISFVCNKGKLKMILFFSNLYIYWLVKQKPSKTSDIHMISWMGLFIWWAQINIGVRKQMLILLYILVWTCFTLLLSVKTLKEIRLYISLKAVWSWPTSGTRNLSSVLLQDFLNPDLHLETQCPVLHPCLYLLLVFRPNSTGQSWDSLLVFSLEMPILLASQKRPLNRIFSYFF